MKQKGERLGDWTCQSGNNVVAYLEPGPYKNTYQLRFLWDSPLPLSRADQLEYDARILPEVTRLFGEFTERIIQKVLVVRATP